MHVRECLVSASGVTCVDAMPWTQALVAYGCVRLLEAAARDVWAVSRAVSAAQLEGCLAGVAFT